MSFLTRILVAAAAAAAAVAVWPGEDAMRLTSSAFADGEPIPPRFTADGEDVSPPLEIAGAPEGTRSLALICDDPDAPMGTWVHWVVWNLPADTARIEEGTLPEGAAEGRNSWRRAGWGGPSPPSGRHRYIFKLFALDVELELPETTDASALRKAMEGHVLARGELLGTYARIR